MSVTIGTLSYLSILPFCKIISDLRQPEIDLIKEVI
uniref:Bm14202 n=1 Tax=Brugia malayi TaxID=6279 RepID=A0A1I9G2D0_BRUMA|nr:Bm14202 [Brugia malayi]